MLTRNDFAENEILFTVKFLDEVFDPQQKDFVLTTGFENLTIADFDDPEMDFEESLKDMIEDEDVVFINPKLISLR